MKQFIILVITSLCINTGALQAQGPPIRTDKPIMLGENKGTIRTLYQYFKSEDRHYHLVPIMLDYNLKNNIEIGVELPFAALSDTERREGFKAGDLMLRAKYQFVRRDGMGKTFRMAAKAVSMLPTGRNDEAPLVGMGTFQNSIGLLAGMESLKYGVVGEMAYNHMGSMHPSFLDARLAFGLPLLKPAYPVKQMTLYFEYEGKWMPEVDGYALYYAQGIQFAFRNYAFELSVQMPLLQEVPAIFVRDLSLLTGVRIVI
jgi:hypothetical protein